ncbi:MAG TPA: cytochrome c [Candidatus Cybelea sp.]|jgi:mono/diheme cytochrome c family protein|nr:cytochrome c [Candidatus Cybelea sp.]
MLRRKAGAIFLSWELLIFSGMSAHAIGSDLFDVKPDAQPRSRQVLREKRSSGLDLEVRGDLAGLPAGSVRYIAREDLKALPQVTYTVTDDRNFVGAVEVRGVALEVLAREFAGSGEKALIVAVSGDLYRAHYPQGYVQAHRPVLVMEIDGEGPASWPKSKEGSGSAMGPYLISHPHFTPSFKVLGNEEEPQIPWGVVRLEFRSEEAIFGEIAPPAVNAGEAEVHAGYRIARQNCLRCHGPASYGRLKGQIAWSGIAFFADSSPRGFAAYVRNPRSVAQSAEMPGNPAYDDATVEALIAYFRTFLVKGKP